MTDTTDLMKGHLIHRERVPGSAIQTRRVLYFRADTVIALLQERNAHLQEISDRLAKAVEKHKARREFLSNVMKYVSRQECRCRYYGDGEGITCHRCDLLDEYNQLTKEDSPCQSNDPASS